MGNNPKTAVLCLPSSVPWTVLDMSCQWSHIPQSQVNKRISNQFPEGLIVYGKATADAQLTLRSFSDLPRDGNMKWHPFLPPPRGAFASALRQQKTKKHKTTGSPLGLPKPCTSVGSAHWTHLCMCQVQKTANLSGACLLKSWGWLMSWVGNGRENVFPWLLQDRGKQPGSGNPLSKARGKKKEINWDPGGTHSELSADTVVSWSATGAALNCWKQPASQTRRPQRGTNLSWALFTNNAGADTSKRWWIARQHS